MAITGKRLDEICGNGLGTFSNVMARYFAGVICRERERIAQILENEGRHETAAQIRSGDQDEQVFRWASPDVKLNDPLLPHHTSEAARRARADKPGES
jgi:hypothetical protein